MTLTKEVLIRAAVAAGMDVRRSRDGHVKVFAGPHMVAKLSNGTKSEKGRRHLLNTRAALRRRGVDV